MSILTKDKVTEIFFIADDFCKELEKVIHPSAWNHLMVKNTVIEHV